jgi:hypothetical protein
MIQSFESFSSRNRFWTCPVDKSIYPVEDLWDLALSNSGYYHKRFPLKRINYFPKPISSKGFSPTLLVSHENELFLVDGKAGLALAQKEGMDYIGVYILPYERVLKGGL